MAIISADVLAVTASAFGAAAALVSSLVVWLQTHRDRVNRSRYNLNERAADLSMMRSAYEDRIAEITSRLTATQERWAEVNHLLLDAQRNQVAHMTTSQGAAKKGANSFTSSLGIQPGEIQVDPKFVFVLTPFAKSERRIYDAIRNVCLGLGLRASRGDEEFIDGPILPHVVREILRAKMIIANISSRNPNVLYELGVAQALGKPTVLISRSEVSSLPFDIRGRRVVFFENERDLEQKLIAELARWMVDAPYDNTLRDQSV